MAIPKQGQEVIRDFQSAGLSIQVVAKAKHYLVYHEGVIVYKFGQGTKAPVYAKGRRAAVIRRLVEQSAPELSPDIE